MIFYRQFFLFSLQPPGRIPLRLKVQMVCFLSAPPLCSAQVAPAHPFHRKQL